MAVEGTARPISDRLLVEAVRAGSVTAFEGLVKRYDAQLRAFLYRLTGDAEVAADLTQETFLDVHRCRATLPTDRPFAAWLYRTARYNALPLQRRQRLYRFMSLDWLIAHLTSVIPGFRRSDAVGDVHERDLIERALDEISPGLREALILSAIGGFTGEEVANIMDISPAAARKRVSRATAEFRRIYQQRLEREAAHDLM